MLIMGRIREKTGIPWVPVFLCGKQDAKKDRKKIYGEWMSLC